MQRVDLQASRGPEVVASQLTAVPFVAFGVLCYSAEQAVRVQQHVTADFVFTNIFVDALGDGPTK